MTPLTLLGPVAGALRYLVVVAVFATMVGGVLAQLMGYGKAHHLSLAPTVLKAVVLAGTEKVSHFDGSAWTPRDQTDTSTGPVIDEPLDAARPTLP